MKKNTKSKGVIFSFWHKVLLDGRISKIVIDFRKKIGVPDNGFSSSNSHNAWLKKFLKTRKDSERISVIYDFIGEMKKIVPYVGILKEVHFKMLMIEFFYYNSIEDEMLESMKYSEMEVVLIKDGTKRFSGSKEISDGVYIKIGPFTTKDLLKNFIDERKKLIKEFQDLFMALNGISKIKKPKNSDNFKRDLMILALDEYSKKEIEEYFGIKADYKETAISLLMNEMGIKGVTQSIVKSVKKRRKME